MESGDARLAVLSFGRVNLHVSVDNNLHKNTWRIRTIHEGALHNPLGGI
jgi:hypothetical protein